MGVHLMSGLSWFILAVVGLFTLGMMIDDPEEAHRPPPVREDARLTIVTELYEV